MPWRKGPIKKTLTLISASKTVEHVPSGWHDGSVKQESMDNGKDESEQGQRHRGVEWRQP